MSYYNWLRRTHKKVEEPDPPAAPTWEFDLGVNLFQAVTASPQLVYSNIDKNRGGFGTISDPTRAGVVYPTLNSVDRYPTQDFAISMIVIPYSASAQTMHCRLLGTATITCTPSGTWAITNQIVTGTGSSVITTFDIEIDAGAAETPQGVLFFASTRRSTADSAGTGCRGLYIRSPGIALDDTAQLMPYMTHALEPFTYIRFMNPLDSWTNLATRTPANRATPTRKPYWPGWETPQTVSLEECVMIANELDKDGWFPIPVAADDDLMLEWAQVVHDNLDSDKWALFELSNEIWNASALNTLSWSVTKAMDMVNGFVWQYLSTKTCTFISRSSGVATGVFSDVDGHGCAPGDIVYTASISGANAGDPASAPSGYKTILTTPDAHTCTWAEAGLPDYAQKRAKTGGQWRQGRLLVSATRASNVMTIVFGQNHNMTAGVTQIKALNITGLANSTLITVASTPNARTITVPCTGADGTVAFSGGSVLVSDFTSILNSEDLAVDQHILARRWYAMRTKQYSDIIAGVFGGEFGSRAKVGLFNQPTVANDLSNQCEWLALNYGPVKNYIHVIGKGSYAQLNALGFPGGDNLRDVTTFDGNTPPSMQNYADTWEITAEHIKDGTGPNTGGYDSVAVTARLHEVELWSYEWGPDATASNGGNVSGGAGTAAGLSKINTLHDAVFDTAYRKHLDTLENAYFRKATVFNSGTCAVGNSSATQSWGIFRDFTDPEGSVRWAALTARNAATRTGPTRNLISASAPVTIDGRAIVNVYEYTGYSGAFPSVVVGNDAMQNWLISAPEDGDWEFEPTFNSSSGTRNIIVQVNGVPLPNYVVPVGDTTFPPVTLSLTKGHNVIRTVPGTANPGVTVTCKSFLFTPV